MHKARHVPKVGAASRFELAQVALGVRAVRLNEPAVKHHRRINKCSKDYQWTDAHRRTSQRSA